MQTVQMQIKLRKTNEIVEILLLLINIQKYLSIELQSNIY